MDGKCKVVPWAGRRNKEVMHSDPSIFNAPFGAFAAEIESVGISKSGRGLRYTGGVVAHCAHYIREKRAKARPI